MFLMRLVLISVVDPLYMAVELPVFCMFVVDLQSYLMRFQWDMAKFPINQAVKSITDQISKQMSQIEADLKNKASNYNSIKGNLQSLEKKAQYV